MDARRNSAQITIPDSISLILFNNWVFSFTRINIENCTCIYLKVHANHQNITG